jgi:nucleotide-binding universal stress UspA family protein
LKQETKGTEFFKILVAIDGSETSMKAAEYAINLSKIQNQQEKQEEITTTATELVALAVIDLTKMPTSFLATISGYSGAMELEEKRKEAQQWLDRVKTLAKEQNFNIGNFTSVIIEDISSRVGYAIVDYAESKSIDLIVIGTRGRTGLKKMLLGSVASNVVTYAHCPVLVVRP